MTDVGGCGHQTGAADWLRQLRVPERAGTSVWIFEAGGHQGTHSPGVHCRAALHRTALLLPQLAQPVSPARGRELHRGLPALARHSFGSQGLLPSNENSTFALSPLRAFLITQFGAFHLVEALLSPNAGHKVIIAHKSRHYWSCLRRPLLPPVLW